MVHGELLRLIPAVASSTLAELDALEEFAGPGCAGNVYERVEVMVEAGESDAPVRAWVYVSLITNTPSEAVEDGNWARYMRERGLVDAADDWAASRRQG